MDSVLLMTIISSLGGAAAYWLGRVQRRVITQKTYEEVESLRIQNLKSTIDIYKLVHDELSEQLKQVSEECVKLRDEITILRQENISLKKELHELNKKFSKTV